MAVTITKPTIGGSEDSWGLTINTALDDIVDGLNGVTAVEPNLTAGSWEVGGVAVTSTAAELNILDGVTSTAAELNILDGVTATASEINVLDGISASTIELNLLSGVTASTAEINFLDGVTSNVQTQINNLNDGTVTSVSLSAPTGFSVSGSPVTSSGTLSLSFASGYSLLTSAQATSISNIPTNNNQLTNGAGYITSADVPAQSTDVGAIGTYAWLWRDNAGAVQGTSYSGSSLFYAVVNDDGQTAVAANTYRGNGTVRSGTSPSGTWRSMGSSGTFGSTYGHATLYVTMS